MWPCPCGGSGSMVYVLFDTFSCLLPVHVFGRVMPPALAGLCAIRSISHLPFSIAHSEFA